MALSREVSLPSGVRGPVERRAFSRLIAARSVVGGSVLLIWSEYGAWGCWSGTYFLDVVERKGELRERKL
jgi:hypothetical protein